MGELAEERSRTVLFFSARSPRERFLADPAWQHRCLPFLPAGLPGDCGPLFAADHGAFAYAGSRGVSHGGISLEEAVVPVAEVFSP